MAKKETNLTTGISDPQKVDEYMKTLKHPLKETVEYLRKIILDMNNQIGEGIYWNAPTFFYTGKMKPFNPKEYRRYLAGFVFNKQDKLRLVFLRGALIKDSTGLLEGDFKDDRKLAVFSGLEDVRKKEKALKNVIQQLIKSINDF